MAKKVEGGKQETTRKVTSIGGHPRRSRPKNKNKRISWKPYKGQGRK